MEKFIGNEVFPDESACLCQTSLGVLMSSTGLSECQVFKRISELIRYEDLSRIMEREKCSSEDVEVRKIINKSKWTRDAFHKKISVGSIKKKEYNSFRAIINRFNRQQAQVYGYKLVGGININTQYFVILRLKI